MPNLESSPPQQKRRLILLPAHNESMNLARVLAWIRSVLPDVDILVVDDGSEDDTYAVALAEGARAARHPINLGYGAAVQTGYRYALELGYHYLAQMDADGQHQPEDVKQLFEILEQDDVDLVIGSRFLPESGPYPMPWLRRAGQAYMRTLVKLLTGRRFADPTSGLQAMNRRVLWLFSSEAFPSDYPDADVLVMVCKAGIKVVQAPASMRTREFGTSMHAGAKWVYYLFRMTLSLLVIALGRGFPAIPAELQRAAIDAGDNKGLSPERTTLP